jgi:TonB family protein
MNAADRSANSPGTFVVRLSSQFLKGLSAHLQEVAATQTGAKTEAQTDPGGLLFGLKRTDLVRVSAFKPFTVCEPTSTVDAAIDAAIADWKADRVNSSLELIGWYVIRPASPIALPKPDAEIHNRHFQLPADLLMIVKPEQNEFISADVFSAAAGAILSIQDHNWGSVRFSAHSSFSEPIDLAMRAKINDQFFLRTYEVGDSVYEPKLQVQSAAPSSKALINITELRGLAVTSIRAGTRLRRRTAIAPELAPQVQDAEAPTLTRAARPWSRKMIVVVLASGIVLGLIYRQARSFTNVKAGSGVIHLASPSDLGLQVGTEGDSLLLTWNPRAAAIQSAEYGVLRVYDGSTSREFRLERSQIAKGSKSYRSAADDVTFCLAVHTGKGPAVLEMARVVGRPKDGRPSYSALPTASQPPSGALSRGNRESRPSVMPPATPAKTPYSAVSHLPRETVSPPVQTPSRTDPDAGDHLSHEILITENHPNLPSALPPLQLLSPSQFLVPSVSPTIPDKKPEIASLPVKAPAAADTHVPPSVPLYTPPLALKRAMPRPPWRWAIENPTDIPVTLRIDETGQVVDAQVAPNGAKNNNRMLARLAIEAAKQWVFEPAKVQGKKVPAEHTIVFHFAAKSAE